MQIIPYTLLIYLLYIILQKIAKTKFQLLNRYYMDKMTHFALEKCFSALKLPQNFFSILDIRDESRIL